MSPALTWLSDDVVGFEAGHANAYLWRHGSTATLFDTGQSGSESVVLDVLSSLGLPERDLVRIVLTHWHHDHTGAAAALAGRTGAQVCAGRDDADVIRGHHEGAAAQLTDAERPLMARLEGQLPPAPPCRIDPELDDGDTLEVSDRSQHDAVVIGTPGHTPGSIAIHLPGQRVLLTGDVLVHLDGVPTLGPFNTDRDQALRSLRRLASLDVDAVGPGHGPPITHDATAALAGATDPLG